MVRIEKIDTRNKGDVNRFVMFPHKIFKNCPQWVPPFIGDIKLMLNRDKHPFYEHSDGDFFLAYRGDEVVGRLGSWRTSLSIDITIPKKASSISLTASTIRKSQMHYSSGVLSGRKRAG
jgi:hypothetical protein